MGNTAAPQKVRRIACPKPLAFTANGGDSQQIPGGMLLREITLRLTFGLTTSANLAAAAILAGGEWGLIKTISIKAGTEVIKEFSGEELRVFNMLWFRRRPRPRLTLGSTTTNVDSMLILPFWDPLSRRPIDCALNTSAYGNLRIEVQWNNYDKIASTATAFATTPQLEWDMEASTGAPDNMTIFECRTQRLQLAGPSAAQTDFPVVLQTGLTAIRSLLLYCKDASTPQADLVNKITSVKLKALNTNIWESTFSSIRDQALWRLGLAELVASGAKASICQDAQFDLDNYAFFDFCRDGLLSEAFPTFKLSDLRLLLTTNAAVNNIYVVQNFLIPPTNG